jgi:type IV pilus modification protein PilV
MLKYDKGFALVEVLIAMFIFAFGILSVVELQLTSLTRTLDSYYRTIALNQIASLQEQLSVGDNDFSSWKTASEKMLPNSQAKFTRTSISICWTDHNQTKTCLQQKV